MKPVKHLLQLNSVMLLRTDESFLLYLLSRSNVFPSSNRCLESTSNICIIIEWCTAVFLVYSEQMIHLILNDYHQIGRPENQEMHVHYYTTFLFDSQKRVGLYRFYIISHMPPPRSYSELEETSLIWFMSRYLHVYVCMYVYK